MDMRRLAASVLAAGIAAACCGATFTNTWTGAGGDFLWTNAANWEDAEHLGATAETAAFYDLAALPDGAVVKIGGGERGAGAVYAYGLNFGEENKSRTFTNDGGEAWKALFKFLPCADFELGGAEVHAGPGATSFRGAVLTGTGDWVPVRFYGDGEAAFAGVESRVRLISKGNAKFRTLERDAFAHCEVVFQNPAEEAVGLGCDSIVNSISTSYGDPLEFMLNGKWLGAGYGKWPSSYSSAVLRGNGVFSAGGGSMMTLLKRQSGFTGTYRLDLGDFAFSPTGTHVWEFEDAGDPGKCCVAGATLAAKGNPQVVEDAERGKVLKLGGGRGQYAVLRGGRHAHSAGAET